MVGVPFVGFVWFCVGAYYCAQYRSTSAYHLLLYGTLASQAAMIVVDAIYAFGITPEDMVTTAAIALIVYHNDWLKATMADAVVRAIHKIE